MKVVICLFYASRLNAVSHPDGSIHSMMSPVILGADNPGWLSLCEGKEKVMATVRPKLYTT